MNTDPADVWRATLGDALLAARKDRDATRTSALRCALSAIDNAGAVPTATSSTVEVARRQLSDAQIRALLRAEVDERLAAAPQVTAERAVTLRAEAAVLAGLLGDV